MRGDSASERNVWRFVQSAQGGMAAVYLKEGHMDQSAKGRPTFGQGSQTKPKAEESQPEPSGVEGQIATAASDIARDAQSRAASLASEAKDRLTSVAEDGKGEVAEALEAMAGAVHKTSENLQGQDWLAQMVERGASELGALANTVRGNDLQGLLGKLDELARGHPAIFVGAAMAIGFGAARLGKTVVAGVSEADLPQMPAVVTHGSN
jgi:hypothetical protein